MDIIPLLVILLLLSSFFSGAEIALFSLGPAKIQAMKNKSKTLKEKSRVLRLQEMKQDSDKLLVTILIGNNLVNIGASSMATVLALDIGTQYGLGENKNLIIGVVTGVMTFLILFFGEITPKALAHKHARQYSLFAAPILKILEYVLYPIVIPLAKITKKFMGSRKARYGLSEEELKAAVELSAAEKQINSEEKVFVEKILEFDEHDVSTIMTPRRNVFALQDKTPVPKAIEALEDAKFSRVPVYHETIDDIIGILKIQNLVGEYLKPDFTEKNIANLSLLRPLRVPLTMRINMLLREMQKEQMHMALVYNEHGGFIGLITLEDIMEEIFGEFEDEEDEQILQIRRTGKQEFECHADIELEQIEGFLARIDDFSVPHNWPWTREEENKTLSYFLLEKFGHFPDADEEISLHEDERLFKFIIQEKTKEEKIERVILKIQ